MISNNAMLYGAVGLNIGNAIVITIIRYFEARRMKKLAKEALEMRDRYAKIVWPYLTVEEKRKYKWSMSE